MQLNKALGLIHPYRSNNITTEGNNMNKDKIIALLEDGAYWSEEKLYHHSFRKGFRRLWYSDISWQAVERAHGVRGTNRLTTVDGVRRLSKQA